MTPTFLAHHTRTLELAQTFLEEVRRDVERATRLGATLPPRLRSAHERPGHATPEYRTLAIPVSAGMEGASPEVLSAAIAHFARTRPPTCLLLALEASVPDQGQGPSSLLIAEARDRAGTRQYWVQPFRSDAGEVVWGEPQQGGWADPGEEEMILDAAFQP